MERCKQGGGRSPESTFLLVQIIGVNPEPLCAALTDERWPTRWKKDGHCAPRNGHSRNCFWKSRYLRRAVAPRLRTPGPQKKQPAKRTGSGRKFSAPSHAELEAFPEPMILEKVFSAQVILDKFPKNGQCLFSVRKNARISFISVIKSKKGNITIKYTIQFRLSFLKVLKPSFFYLSRYTVVTHC